jgi:hypothetical protein
MGTLILVVFAVWLAIHLLSAFVKFIVKSVASTALEPRVFNHSYVDTRVLFLKRFGDIPHASYINGVDTDKVVDYLRSHHANEVTACHQASVFNKENGALEFISTVIVLTDAIIVELGREHVEVLFNESGREFMNTLIEFCGNCTVEPITPSTSVRVVGFRKAEMSDN